MSVTGFRGEGTVTQLAEMAMTDASIISIPPRALTVKAFGITDKGKVRTTNEDQFLIAELSKAMRVWRTSLPNRSWRLAYCCVRTA
jgi:hypothetical protein